MRYFWHAMIAIAVLALIVFVLFGLSVDVKDNIAFTDTLDELSEPTVTIADPTIGPDDASVTIVNFSDYECEACADLHQALTEVYAEFPGQVRIVWKDMPNTTTHPEALNAALAAHCAGKQDDEQFFTYQAYLFANQNSLGADLYASLATELGLKATTLTRCIENQDTYALVQRGYEEGLALRLTATPTIYINGERYAGGTSTSQLTSAIRAIIR